MFTVYVVGTLFASDSYVDARQGTGTPILESYTGSLRTLDTANGVNIITFRVTSNVQQSILSRTGLYLWVVNPSTSTWTNPALVQRSNKEQAYGGSDYMWYHVDITGSGATTVCNREPYGVLMNYGTPSVRSTVQAQLASMYQNGQRRLRVPLFVAPDVSSGTVVQAINGNFPAFYLTNLANYLADVKAAGFQEVDVGIFALNGYSLYQDTTYNATSENYYFSLISQAHQVVVNSGLPYLFDLGNEFMPGTGASSVWSTYARNLWSRYVAAYGNTDTVGFSTPSADRISNMAIYGATKPAVVDVHFYQNPTTAYATIDNLLTNQHLPNVDVVIAETFYNDSTYANGLRNQVNASTSGRWLRWVTQWPLSQSGPQTTTCGSQNVQSPLIDTNWLLQGF